MATDPQPDEYVPTHEDTRALDQPLERDPDEIVKLEIPEVQALALASLTVTVANPTPPTNYAYNVYGTPPSPASMVQTDDGNPVAPTVIATPLSVVAPQGTVAEATGTVVIDTELDGKTQSISVMGNFSATPNASHPSSQAPTTLPTITALTPSAPVGNGGTSSLTVTGTGFQPSSTIQVAGVPVYTHYQSATSLITQSAPKRTSAGNSAITVMTNGTATAGTNWVFT